MLGGVDAATICQGTHKPGSIRNRPRKWRSYVESKKNGDLTYRRLILDEPCTRRHVTKTWTRGNMSVVPELTLWGTK